MANTVFRESVQFPPSITSDSTYERSYTDESSLTNNGLYQTVRFHSSEVVEQYLLVNKKKYTLSTDITLDESLEMINNLLK
jgi:hypothetical protein